MKAFTPTQPKKPVELPPACLKALENFRTHAEGTILPAEAKALQAHLKDCAHCREQLASYSRLYELMEKTIGQRRIRADFDQRAEAVLRETPEQGDTRPVQRAVFVNAVPAKLVRAPRGKQEQELATGGYDEVEPLAASAPGLLDRLSNRFGGAPWWMVSGAFHALLLLLLTLIGMALLRAQQDDVVIMTNLEQKKEPPEIKQPLKRDVFKKPVPIETSEPVVSETQIVTHEEVEVAEEVETENDSDAHEAVGDEGISDVPLGGVGTVAAIGLGGGGGGAFGRPNGAGGRLRRAVRNGGGRATESAVDKALQWLARHQEKDGHWDTLKHEAKTQGDTACAGLALLAFLGAGHTEKIGKYKDNVRRAVQWLIARQDGKGHFKSGSNNYGHPIAALALAEAAGMGRIPQTMKAAQKAVDYSVDVQQRKMGGPSEKMGWRYSPQEMGDTSLSGWYIMQIKSAKVAGLHVDPAAFDGASRFLDSVMTEKPDPNKPYSGHHYGYRRDGGPIRVKSPHGNTAIGILCRQFLGVKADELQGGVEFFIKEGGVPNAGHPEFYYWYYATLCCFQQGGDIWKRWNEGLKTALPAMQRKDGDFDGSWDPKGHSVEGAEQQGGRVFTTALGALCLEVYYRYLPMYRK